MRFHTTSRCCGTAPARAGSPSSAMTVHPSPRRYQRSTISMKSRTCSASSTRALRASITPSSSPPMPSAAASPSTPTNSLHTSLLSGEVTPWLWGLFHSRYAARAAASCRQLTKRGTRSRHRRMSCISSPIASSQPSNARAVTPLLSEGWTTPSMIQAVATFWSTCTSTSFAGSVSVRASAITPKRSSISPLLVRLAAPKNSAHLSSAARHSASGSASAAWSSTAFIGISGNLVPRGGG
mmetsp:Transcript_30959/g.80926  ORF Transcript_30959/g.80926 Transcript_30959/m.80926 type:complete len:239 (+) Transcript_30959:271-987(+)